MPDNSARLDLPYILPAQAQKHVTHNEAIERLDFLVQLTVESFGAASPPSTPAEGAVWALGPSPSGAWSGKPGTLAAFVNGGWHFVAQQIGWTAALGSDLRIWDGTEWTSIAQPIADNIQGLGINTSHDTVNRLAVASEATLLTHAGQGHQLKIVKQAAVDTASLLFQTNWSGRAEMGTSGSDAFEIKVSPDGTTWHTALSTDPNTGAATMPNGAQVDGFVSGSAVTQSDADTTPGRLLTTQSGPAQAFRQGNILGAVSMSGGDPAGAIIEHGSTTNGKYLRLADGTQMCWHIMSSSSVAASTWTFPALFIGSDFVPSIVTAGTSAVCDAISSASTSALGFSTFDISGVRVGRLCRLFAIGRWS